MDLLTHFCIASSKRGFGKQCRSRSDAGELGKDLNCLENKNKLNRRIIIIFIFDSFRRMAEKLFPHP